MTSCQDAVATATTGCDMEADAAIAEADMALQNVSQARRHVGARLLAMRDQLPNVERSLMKLEENLTRLERRGALTRRQAQHQREDLAALREHVGALRERSGALAAFEGRVRPYADTLRRLRLALLDQKRAMHGGGGGSGGGPTPLVGNELRVPLRLMAPRELLLERVRYVSRRFGVDVLNLQPQSLDEAGLRPRNSDLCRQCGAELVYQHNDSVAYCSRPQCRRREQYFDNTARTLAFGETYYDYQQSYYQRILHFKDALLRLQAKEPHQVPYAIMYVVLLMAVNLGGRCNGDLSLMFFETVCDALHISRYCDNAPQIYARASNSRPLRLLASEDAVSYALFRAIQEPYNACRDPGQKALFPCNYMLYKFFELCGFWRYLPYLTLLKDAEKLRKHDRTWAACCEHYAHLGWRFVESRPSSVDALTEALRVSRKHGTLEEIHARSTRRQRHGGGGGGDASGMPDGGVGAETKLLLLQPSDAAGGGGRKRKRDARTSEAAAMVGDAPADGELAVVAAATATSCLSQRPATGGAGRRKGRKRQKRGNEGSAAEGGRYDRAAAAAAAAVGIGTASVVGIGAPVSSIMGPHLDDVAAAQALERRRHADAAAAAAVAAAVAPPPPTSQQRIPPSLAAMSVQMAIPRRIPAPVALPSPPPPMAPFRGDGRGRGHNGNRRRGGRVGGAAQPPPPMAMPSNMGFTVTGGGAAGVGFGRGRGRGAHAAGSSAAQGPMWRPGPVQPLAFAAPRKPALAA